MKSRNILILLFFICTTLVFNTSVASERTINSEKKLNKVEKLTNADNFFRSGNMFFSGQPNLETLEWLDEQGVNLIINLRSEGEMEDFAESAFDEEKAVDKLKMNYISVPIAGLAGFTEENLQLFADALAKPYNKVLVHCASCGRVTNFMVAYLVKYQNYTLNDAIEFGKQLKFSFPIEKLLGGKVTFTFQEK